MISCVGWAFGFMHHRERFDVFPSRPPASPVGAVEKSSLNWMFSRLSLSVMSYLPLLSFGLQPSFPLSLSVASTFRRRSASLALPTT